jgi:hypothetical protein
VVQNLLHYPNVKGLSRAAAAATGRKKTLEKLEKSQMFATLSTLSKYKLFITFYL